MPVTGWAMPTNHRGKVIRFVSKCLSRSGKSITIPCLSASHSKPTCLGRTHKFSSLYKVSAHIQWGRLVRLVGGVGAQVWGQVSGNTRGQRGRRWGNTM